MADGNEKGRFESPEDFDFDATVQLNISKDGNIVSRTVADDISPDDFEKTINGILGINEMIENIPASKEEPASSAGSGDEFNFDDLDADINALSEDMAPQAPEPADAEQEDEFNEFLSPKKDSSYNGLPLLEGEEEEFTSSADEDDHPVIELTEDMLDEPDEPDFPGTVKMDQDAYERSVILETPELTTTEKHVLSGATSAIRELTDDDAFAADTLQAPISPAGQPPVAAKGGSGVFAALLGLIGIAAGGFGAWMAFEATNQIDDLKRQIQALSPTVMAKKNQELADIQQRLSKVERRLTGTPTIEAAAPLMTTGSESAKPEQTTPTLSADKPVVKAITPQTEISKPKPAAKTTAAATATGGDWVINLSSHTTESQARKEQERLQKLGLNADISTATVKDKTWYRIRINNFATKDEAKAQLDDVKERSGIKDAWISRK